MTELHTKNEVLAQIPDGWALSKDKDAISKTFTFSTFAAAFGWVSHVALLSEKQNHHPQILYTYRTVEATLTTHDAGGLTEKDIMLADKMNKAAGNA